MQTWKSCVLRASAHAMKHTKKQDKKIQENKPSNGSNKRRV